MTTIEVIGGAIALLSTITGAVIAWMKTRQKKHEELDAKKKEVTDGIKEGFKDRDGTVIARGLSRWRRLF